MPSMLVSKDSKGIIKTKGTARAVVLFEDVGPAPVELVHSLYDVLLRPGPVT